MVRRLLLVLAGLSAAAVAAVLWSGTAYASTPRGLALPRLHVHVPVPAPPSAPALPSPTAPAPRAAMPAPPALPAAPVTVQHVLAVVPPVVDRAVHVVHTVVPVALPVVSTPVPGGVSTHDVSAHRSPASHIDRRASRHATRSFARSAHVDARGALHSSSKLRRGTQAPLAPRRHAPIGDLADSSNRAPQTANGMPFAVTRAQVAPAHAGCGRLGFVRVRVPAAVPLRDVARPG
jgi:hypothetical protein